MNAGYRSLPMAGGPLAPMLSARIAPSRVGLSRSAITTLVIGLLIGDGNGVTLIERQL